MSKVTFANIKLPIHKFSLGTSGPTMEEADSALKNLLEGSVNVKTESLALHDHVEKLMSLYQARETQLIATVAEMRSKCASIIEEATDKASSIHAAAQKASVDSAKVAADTISAAKTTAAEEVDGATEKGQKLIADASAQAAAILATAMKEREDWEAEKASVADIQKFKPELKANVGGTKFTTSLTTLCRFPDTMIGAMYSGRHELVQDDEGYHFIDRDGTHFRYILNFLRAPENFKCELTGAALGEGTDVSFHSDPAFHSPKPPENQSNCYPRGKRNFYNQWHPCVFLRTMLHWRLCVQPSCIH